MSQLASTAERSTRANFIQKKIDEIYQDLEEHDRFKKDKIHNLAGYYKEQVALGELKIPLKDIAKQIIKEIESRGIDISKSTVYDCVPDDCKLDYPEREQEKDSNSGISDLKLTPVASLTPTEIQEKAEEFQKQVEQSREQYRRQNEYLEELKERASREKIALTIPVKASPINTPKPDPKISGFLKIAAEFVEAMGGKVARDNEGNLIPERLEGWLRKIYDFPPNAQDDLRYTKALEPYVEQIRYATDEKFTKGVRGWTETIATMSAGHKHEAAVIHKSMAKIKVKKYDEEGNETEEWIEVPRNMTREQVGDKEEAVLELAIAIINSQPLNEVIEDWHDKYAEPYIAGRKVDLHETLSDKA